MDLQYIIQQANREAGCQLCRGVRFKTCASCGLEANSFHDHRDYQRPRQMYESLREWREVNREQPQSVPERKLQP